jgi:hypothetical protein
MRSGGMATKRRIEAIIMRMKGMVKLLPVDRARTTAYAISRTGMKQAMMNADTLRRRSSRVSLSSLVILSI